MIADLSERDIFESAGPGSIEESNQPEPNPGDTVRAEQERPTPNLGQLPSEHEGAQPQPEGQQANPQDPPRRTMLDDLKDERRRRQEFERSVAERDRQLAEMQGAMRQMRELFGQMQGRGQPQPQAPQQAPEAPDPFVDPQAFAEFQARQVFEQQFSPFAQQMQQREQQVARTLQGLQRMTAAQHYGADEAREAEEAFNTAAARKAIHPLDHQKIQSSDNPFAAAVEWHRREKALTTTGGDPDKWFDSETDRRLREDAAYRERVFAQISGQAQQAAGTAVPAAGRPAPVFTGLPSVNAAAGTSGQAPSGPMSEADIFNLAPPKVGQRR
ncbi:hypothetical protein MKK88_05825 [Methylobacterium sp. E-005]|uniref:hypothetical protein n=1 Tax=Methylobacterium sp. E-005 TaxID=2836549 RepID=UPI001FBB2338|nr:hypothetical protein [Methylobacterium sp. E-005]MCJ2085513.1 hypothetical protein [Methylobacterium sp. E-005]